MTMRVIALLLLAGGFLLPALYGAEVKWRRLETPNFELLTTESDRRARAALLHFEQVRSFFLKVGISAPVSEAKILIVAFQSEKEFKPYRPTESAAAYYQRGYDRDYIVMQNLGPDFLSGATHEYVHLLVQHSGQKLPAWLNEGLADFYSTMSPVGKKVKVGEIIPGRFIAFQESKLLDLPTLFSVDHDSPYYNEKNRTQVFYAQSWALTHMLMMSESYRPKYAEWMTGITAGKPPAEAFQSVYGRDLSVVEKDLNSYFHSNSYNYMLFDTQLEKAAEQPVIEIANELESGLVLASVLAASRKTEEARALLGGLAGKFPADSRIPASLGYAAMRIYPNPDAAGARANFAKAIELNSKDAQLYVDYARLLEDEEMSSGEQELRVRGEASTSRALPVLLKALELRPTQFSVCQELARMLFNRGSYSQAIIALQPLKSLSREQGLQVFRLLAYLYHQVNQPADAKASVERLRRLSQTPEEIAEAEKIGEYLDRPERNLITRNENPEPEQSETQAESDAPAEGNLDDTSRPRLQRREALRTSYVEMVEPQDPLEKVDGVLQHFECLGETVRLTLLTAGRKLVLTLTDFGSVHIRGTGTATIDFTCGPQKPVPVTVEYAADPDAKLGTAGQVKVISFGGNPDF